MSRFRETLSRTSERLDLPQPVKSRIILEIAADLGDVYEECLERGMSEEEAERRAIEICDLSDEALADLVRVHETPVRRFLSSLSEQARTRWEKILLVSLVVFIALFSGREALTAKIFETAGMFAWPVAAAAFAALVLALLNIYRLFIRNEHDPRRVRSGPLGILAAGTVCLLIGVAGAAAGFYRAAMSISADEAYALRHVIAWGRSSSALMMIALLAAILCAAAWFILDGRARTIEAAETAWLFEK